METTNSPNLSIDDIWQTLNETLAEEIKLGVIGLLVLPRTKSYPYRDYEFMSKWYSRVGWLIRIGENENYNMELIIEYEEDIWGHWSRYDASGIPLKEMNYDHLVVKMITFQITHTWQHVCQNGN